MLVTVFHVSQKRCTDDARPDGPAEEPQNGGSDKQCRADADLDGLLLLLAADESAFMNGSIITADDGFGLT